MNSYEDTRDYRFDYAAHKDVGFAKNQKQFDQMKK